MQTVGEMLRGERERKGLTLKDVETVTNIRSVYLNAIEEGNYSVLPGEAYVKGFIRNYANALGLNGSEYVDQYRKSQQPIEVLPVETVEEKATEVQVTPSASSPSVSTRRRQRSRKNETVWIGALLTLLVIGGVWWYMFAEKDAPKPQASPQAQQPVPSGSVQPQPPAQVAPAKPAEKPVIVVAKFLNRSWIQVMADDKQIFEGIPQPGESMTWQADQKITVKVGNAGAVEVTHNGQSIGKLGGSGEVVLKTFTSSGRQ